MKDYKPVEIEAKWPHSAKASRGKREYDHNTIEEKWPFDSAQGKQEYNHKAIEGKWQERWTKAGIYEPDLKSAKNPFYNLMMFPYPSAEGLHVGNMYAFCGSDIYGRFKRMQGNDVFEPIGLDGFGIHSENYAMKIGEHPMKLSKKTQDNFYRQLNSIGNGFAWNSKLETYDPQYYRWTQWIFVQLFKAGLAYRAQGEVNWCPSCMTVLADEQAISKQSTVNGQRLTVVVCERCGTEVERKKLAQWYFRITKYSQQLLDGLDKIDWSEKVKVAQRGWIGRSEGAEIVFSIDIDKLYLVRIFTTRVDTLFGVTFLALATDHDLVTTILKKANSKHQQAIRDFLEKSNKTRSTKSLPSRQAGEIRNGEEKNGVFTGFFAQNPANGEKVPVYIANYVLTGYGTGAVMGVPAHDERDWEFAKKYDLDINAVVIPTGPVTTFPPASAQSSNPPKPSQPSEVEFLRAVGSPSSSATRGTWDFSQQAFTGYGKLINSGKYTGLDSHEAMEKMVADLGWDTRAKKSVNWHLRDWIISRQRYWGPPIPMVYCGKCAREEKSWFTENKTPNSKLLPSRQAGKTQKFGNWNLEIGNSAQWAAGWYPVGEEDLPVELPYVEQFKPTGSGVSPLAEDPEFVRTKCPGCGGTARRETDVSDTFLDSAWYFLRYPSVGNENGELKIKNSKLSNLNSNLPWDADITRRWLPVDMYIGGAEHAVLHLLYSRFITRAFYDMGLLEFDEPFTKFRAHGLLIKDGAKMSKSKGNVVTPDDYIAKFGADALRTYLMFCGRFAEGGDFRDDGIEGMQRFLRRVWRMVGENSKLKTPALPAGRQNSKLSEDSERMMHKTIKKVTEDIEQLSYNTAIAALMEWLNFLEEKVNFKFQISNFKSNKPKEKTTVNHEPRLDRGELLTMNELKTLLLLLAPFAPHMTEELFQQFFGNPKLLPRRQAGETRNSKQIPSPKQKEMENFKSIHFEKWPGFDGRLALGERATLVVQVDGRLRGKIEVARGTGQEEAQSLALGLDNVSKYVGDGSGFGVIFVADRLINFVSKSGKN